MITALLARGVTSVKSNQIAVTSVAPSNQLRRIFGPPHEQHVRPTKRRTASRAFDDAHRFVATGLIDVASDYGGASACKTSRNGATAPGATSAGDDYHANVIHFSNPDNQCTTLSAN